MKWSSVAPAGPKLFVTPSQKSNRHIIVNAISHRCLAGTVNQEVKNRVLEVGVVYIYPHVTMSDKSLDTILLQIILKWNIMKIIIPIFFFT